MALRMNLRRVMIPLVPLTLLLSCGLVYRASVSAFTATTSNAANSWTTGSIALADDDSSSAAFTATGLVPGATHYRCIVVTYTGNTSPAPIIKLYASSSGALATNMTITVTDGTAGGTFAGGVDAAGCNPTGGSTIVNAVALGSMTSSYASGYGTWQPAASGETRVYKIAYTIGASPGMSANATATFTWEAQA